MQKELDFYLTNYTVLGNLNFLVPLRFFILLTIYGSSSHLRLDNDNVRKYQGIPNCLTIASTSYKTFSSILVFLLTELINENALTLATNLSIVPLKLFLTVLAVSVPDLILCIAKFIDERKWCCSYTDMTKKIQSASDAKY